MRYRHPARLRRVVLACVASTAVLAVNLPASTAAPDIDAEEAGRQVEALHHKAEQATERYNEVRIALTDAERRFSRAQRSSASQQVAVRDLQQSVGALAADIYRSGGLDRTLELVFAEDPEAFLARASVLDAVSAREAATLRRVVEARRELQAAQDVAAEQLAAVEAQRKALATEKVEIEQNLRAARTVLKGLEAEERKEFDRASRDNARTPLQDLPVPDSARAAKAVHFALAQLGERYVWGATGPDAWDCSGLTMGAWKAAGVSLPHSSAQQYATGRKIPRSELAPGDLVYFYSPISHVAIYIGNGQMVDAPNPSKTVRILPISYMPLRGGHTAGLTAMAHRDSPKPHTIMTGIRTISPSPAVPPRPPKHGPCLVWSPMRKPRVAAVFGGAVLPLIAGLFAVSSAAPAESGAAGAPTRFKAALADAAYTCPHLPAGLQAALIDVESGWDAAKEGPGGTQGLAQLSPRMWALWGGDADGDGTNSPLDSADAIDTQARMLCQFYRQAVQSSLRGDRLSLALAAYRLGWNRLQEVGGLGQLPATRQYVAEVKNLAPQYAKNLGVVNNSRSLYTPLPNPRTPTSAVRWARSMVGDYGWLNLCLNFMAQAYGWDHSGTRYAIDHWLFTPNSMRHHRQRDAPAGALMFWDTGLRAGHVAISLGDGYVATNDVITPGRISIVPASTIDARWNARYLGWTPPYFPDGV